MPGADNGVATATGGVAVLTGAVMANAGVGVRGRWDMSLSWGAKAVNLRADQPCNAVGTSTR
ncbi:hypothetical protein GCM10018980_72210 [Streptomyces capoamus]|uniref:Uncharacterized protein n=1 Tax=Streptomyces capoamus TaxID=68183 RepID=A0A919F423_9ACTN|nr:hypothetical protein GCM10010501_16850 [Streptomyces libani subsp. rufus]GHG74988.1 hypothetical protein GCM10018980_72210 [Streptomyces capoamus]